ncbi:coat protein [Plantain virus X]|uniref:Coat protein n=1 Tax=Plantain virus X TaxID=1331744 RepID=A0A0S2ZXS3_9VIRU|nr:coat protein [Plantain virus X]ALQ43530.1 coat protein [Plantain virus X]
MTDPSKNVSGGPTNPPPKVASGSAPPQGKTPEPTPTDTSDPTRGPSLSQLRQVKYVSATTSVATPEEIKLLGSLYERMGIDKNEVAPAMWDLARAYADVQSSQSAVLVGTTPSNPAITRQALSRQVLTINVTPRQFCSYFAKVVWNMCIDSGIAPANWVKMGLQEPERFAGFDFFEAVLSPAALEPEGGLVRQPTMREIQAHALTKAGALARQKIQNGNYISNLAEVTRGRVGGVNTMYAIEEPPEL